MKDNNKSNYDTAKKGFNHVDDTFRLLAVFHNVIQSLLDLHVMLTAALEALSQIIPPLALLFMGLGHLATLWRPQEKSKKSKTSKGIKLFIGLSMIAIAAVSIAFPPAGIAMVATGLGLGIGLTCYKMWRTSYKLSQAKKAAQKAAENNNSQEQKGAQLNVDKHSHKLFARKINLGVTLATCVLVAVLLAFPPAGVACLGLLVGLNAGYTLYRARAPIARFIKKTGRSIARVLGLKVASSSSSINSMQAELQPTPTPQPQTRHTKKEDEDGGESDGGAAHVMQASASNDEDESDGEISQVMHAASQQEDSHKPSNKNISRKKEHITSTKLSSKKQLDSSKPTQSMPSTKQPRGLNTSTRDFLRHEKDTLMELNSKHPPSFSDKHPTEPPNILRSFKIHDESDKNISDFLNHEQQALTKNSMAATKDIKSNKYIEEAKVSKKETVVDEEDSEGGSGDADVDQDDRAGLMNG